jgi:tetratricopeptide (TPR) repeat protein
VSARARRLAVFICCAAFAPAIARAQSTNQRPPLKSAGVDATPRPVCSDVKPGGSPTDEQRQRARDLVQRGQQAAILGDGAAALRDLREASTLDPTDADLAYQLARMYESAQDAANATKEYCRFLALAPTAPEAGEAVEKVRVLASATGGAAISPGTAIFRIGVLAYERGELAFADTAFTNAITADSTWADAYYNRGRVRLERGDRDRARADFMQYVRLRPQASDRAVVDAQIDALGRPAFSSLRAFSLGVVVPGAGHFYTRRPMRGVLTMLAVSGAVGVALLEKSTTISVQGTATDPFGNPYPITTTSVKTERPYFIAGVAAAGGIAAVSALNAALFARSASRVSRVALSVVPLRTGLALRVSAR